MRYPNDRFACYSFAGDGSAGPTHEVARVDATPTPGREPLDLNRAVRNAVTASFGDVVVGLSLLLLFSFSFVGAWFQTQLFCPEPVTGPGPLFSGGAGICSEWVAGGTLWSGFGLLPALLLVAAMLLFLVRRLSRVRLGLPVPEGVVWMLFAAVETGLFLLYWLVPGAANESPYLSSATATPGWAFWVAVGLGGPLFAGGVIKLVQGDRGLPAPSPSSPRAEDPSLAARQLSPAGPRLGEVVVGVALTALFAFSFVGHLVPGERRLRGQPPHHPRRVHGLPARHSGLSVDDVLLRLALVRPRRPPRGPRRRRPTLLRGRQEPPAASASAHARGYGLGRLRRRRDGLLVLNWVTSNGGVNSTAPGWAFWVAIGLGGLLGAGGCVMFVQGERSLPQGSAPMLLPHPADRHDLAGRHPLVRRDGLARRRGGGPPQAPRSPRTEVTGGTVGWRPVPTAPNGGGRVRGRRSRSSPPSLQRPERGASRVTGARSAPARPAGVTLRPDSHTPGPRARAGAPRGRRRGSPRAEATKPHRRSWPCRHKPPPASGGRGPLRPPDQPVESQDARLHLPGAQRRPHHRPGEDPRLLDDARKRPRTGRGGQRSSSSAPRSRPRTSIVEACAAARPTSPIAGWAGC